MSKYDTITTADGETVEQNVAYHDGYKAGEAAGSWVIDGNTPTETAAAILRGYSDGDPEIMDMMPSPLSGEWAGEGMAELLGDDYTDEDADEYENGYQLGFWAQVVASAQAVIGDD